MKISESAAVFLIQQIFSHNNDYQCPLTAKNGLRKEPYIAMYAQRIGVGWKKN
jgi:hypothetical protein